MQGILLSEATSSYKLVNNILRPTPGKNQILVKSLVAGLNPVEEIQRQTGICVTEWPVVLGCDASGLVVKIGEGVEKFQQGDRVFGCTRLGAPGYGTFQEYFLMDEDLAFKKLDNVSTEEAATIGVGILTASLGLISGMKIPLEAKKCNEDSEWVIIHGAAGCVGQYGVQLAKLCGFKVLASCSPSNNQVVENLGADATLNYKIPLDEQLKEIRTITGGRFSRVFDASAMATDTGMTALANHSEVKSTKYFATTNGWMPIEPQEGIKIDVIALGLIGQRSDAHGNEVNSAIASFIPKLEEYFASGALKPNVYEQIGGTGVEEVLKGLEAFSTRKSDGKKLVVRLAPN